MEIVKTESLKNQFRRAAKRSDELTDKIARLQKGEALVISAKEADKWKYPAQTLRGAIINGYKSKEISKSNKYSVNNLKSGSYAIVCHAK